MNLENLKRYNELYTVAERKKLIGEMLKAFREANKLQQKQVAEYIGVNPQTYSAYESGRNEPPAEVLVRLSLLYEIEVDILIQKDNMSKNGKSAKEQLDYYDQQMDELREQILKGNPEAQNMLNKLLDGLSDMTKAIREKIPDIND